MIKGADVCDSGLLFLPPSSTFHSPPPPSPHSPLTTEITKYPTRAVLAGVCRCWLVFEVLLFCIECVQSCCSFCLIVCQASFLLFGRVLSVCLLILWKDFFFFSFFSLGVGVGDGGRLAVIGLRYTKRLQTIFGRCTQ